MASYLFMLALSAALRVGATPLSVRADPESGNNDTGGLTTEDSGPDGHLNQPWIVAVAVSVVVIILSVAGIIIFIKWRQRRQRRNYSHASDERAWKGPYISRSSYSRAPSPPMPVHLSEKTKEWAAPHAHR